MRRNCMPSLRTPPHRGVRNAERRGQCTAIPPANLAAAATPVDEEAQAQLRTVSRFLPGRGRSRSPAIPRAANRWRHRPTVFGRTPSSRDTSSFRLPSRQARMILARSTERASSVRLRARFVDPFVARPSTTTPPRPGSRDTSTGYANLRYHTKYRTSMRLDTSSSVRTTSSRLARTRSRNDRALPRRRPAVSPPLFRARRGGSTLATRRRCNCVHKE